MHPDRAIVDYSKPIELDPKFADAYNNRGIAYKNKNDKQTAIDNLNKAAELYQQQGKTSDQQDALDLINKLQ